MSATRQLLCFTIEHQRFAVDLALVQRSHRAAAIRPLPAAPAIVLGVINVRGRILPAIDLRRRFGLPLRALKTSDQLIVAHTGRREVVLVVDRVQDVLEFSEDSIASASGIVPDLQHLAGVVRLDDGMILIHDLGACLTLDEERALDAALEEA